MYSNTNYTANKKELGSIQPKTLNKKISIIFMSICSNTRSIPIAYSRCFPCVLVIIQLLHQCVYNDEVCHAPPSLLRTQSHSRGIQANMSTFNIFLYLWPGRILCNGVDNWDEVLRLRWNEIFSCFIFIEIWIFIKFKLYLCSPCMFNLQNKWGIMSYIYTFS